MSHASPEFTPEIIIQIQETCALRKDLVTANLEGAYRLYSGFGEGFRHLVIDRFHHTLIFFDYSPEGNLAAEELLELAEKIRQTYPDLKSIILKVRNSGQAELRKGVVLWGETPDRWIREDGIRYAINLQMNQDASFYIDTRNLRRWLINNASGKTVFNTFAYTGSLGVAATAGAARQVIQTDLNRAFLNLAKKSSMLNGYAVHKPDYINGDFFRVIQRLKKEDRIFDIAILDPPFFSDTKSGRVDIVNEYQRLLNKLRPLVAHNGILVAINNAVFLPGSAYMEQLEELCQNQYLSIEDIIAVPEDCVGYAQFPSPTPFIDPAPFNHSTKIVLLRVTRKDERISA
ncbi:MAG: class I SAM-dependent methyltransferase [Anaerolineae bacterium]|jgi:23S rRNA (cytosine1962-C5)-methyltransferase|nr:class I SAM-dependent methyltransferase [Anaerolineae bacterium]